MQPKKNSDDEITVNDIQAVAVLLANKHQLYTVERFKQLWDQAQAFIVKIPLDRVWSLINTILVLEKEVEYFQAKVEVYVNKKCSFLLKNSNISVIEQASPRLS